MTKEINPALCPNTKNVPLPEATSKLEKSHPIEREINKETHAYL